MTHNFWSYENFYVLVLSNFDFKLSCKKCPLPNPNPQFSGSEMHGIVRCPIVFWLDSHGNNEAHFKMVENVLGRKFSDLEMCPKTQARISEAFWSRQQMFPPKKACFGSTKALKRCVGPTSTKMHDGGKQ
jgi:hypothetical protein